eukprot:14482249-Ditylum_brightwellii.AAC.1
MVLEDDMILDEVMSNMAVFYSRYSCFESFYIEMEKLLSDQAIENDCRYSQVSLCNLFISVCDWHEQVMKTLLEGSGIPSERLLYLQFSPAYAHCCSARVYKSCFNMKKKVQTRQLVKYNVDSQYSNAVFRMMHKFTVKNGSDIVKFIPVDDKAKIKVGEPDTPLVLIARERLIFQE